MKTEAMQKEMERQMTTLEHPDTENAPYRSCQQLANHTRELIDREEEKELRNCLGKMLVIYCSSRSVAVKTAIENVFLFSLSNSILLCSKRRWILPIMPGLFRKMLSQQVSTFGI